MHVSACSWVAYIFQTVGSGLQSAHIQGWSPPCLSVCFLEGARWNGNTQYRFHYGEIRIRLPVSIDIYPVSQQGGQDSVCTAFKTNVYTHDPVSHGSPNFSTTFSRRQVAFRSILKQLEVLDGQNKWCLWESTCSGWMDGLTSCSTEWLVCSQFTNKCLAVPACFAGFPFLACWNPIILRFLRCRYLFSSS